MTDKRDIWLRELCRCKITSPGCCTVIELMSNTRLTYYIYHITFTEGPILGTRNITDLVMKIMTKTVAVQIP